MFCSRVCKNRNLNTRWKIYSAQQSRAISRKTLLIDKLGGRCTHCGYSRNQAALQFHHSSGRKSFPLDARNLANRRWSAIEAEAAKCILLCSNCHAEEHHPCLALPRSVRFRD
jgi:hypothetical protein